MRARQIWGWIVLPIGLLWLIGGLFGLTQRSPGAVLFVFCGLILTRMGYRFIRE